MHHPCLPLSSAMATHFPLTSLLLLLLLLLTSTSSATSLCRSSCGPIPIAFPFSIDDGCGHPSFRRLLSCRSSLLLLRTPSGPYPVLSLSYSDPTAGGPHLVVSDPSASCHVPPSRRRAPPFSLDASTPLSLSPATHFLFLNCSPDSVLIRPQPASCARYPSRCDSACDSAGYLCRNPPRCPGGGASPAAELGTSCCTYQPAASESLRLMMANCESYAAVYWRPAAGGGGGESTTPYDRVPEYGIRVDFEIPATSQCRRCQEEGGGTCGFDTESTSFLCMCGDGGNVTTTCEDAASRHRVSVGVIAGTTTAVSVVGASGIGALVWYLRKMRTNRVACGVQTNENRLF